MKDIQNNMIRKTIIAVVILLVVIGDLVYYKMKDPMTEDTETSKLITLNKVDIEKIEVFDNSDGEITTYTLLEAGDGGIVLKERKSEYKDTATKRDKNLKSLPQPDENTLKLFEFTITNLESLKTIQKDVTDFKQYGLDDPMCRVEIKMKNGDELGVSVGKTTPTSNAAYYAKLNHNNTVYTISRWDVTNILLKSDNILDLTKEED